MSRAGLAAVGLLKPAKVPKATTVTTRTLITWHAARRGGEPRVGVRWPGGSLAAAPTTEAPRRTGAARGRNLPRGPTARARPQPQGSPVASIPSRASGPPPRGPRGRPAPSWAPAVPIPPPAPWEPTGGGALCAPGLQWHAYALIRIRKHSARAAALSLSSQGGSLPTVSNREKSSAGRSPTNNRSALVRL